MTWPAVRRGMVSRVLAEKRRRSPEPAPSARRAALLPATAVLVFCLAYVLAVPWPLALAAAAPFVALFVLAPRWARTSIRELDRDLVSAFAAGDVARARARYARALGMRCFGAPAHRAERRARIAMASGDTTEARRHYARAFDGWERPADVPVAIVLGYAHACHSSRHDADAVIAYRRVLSELGALPLVRRNLSWSLARSEVGGPRKTARRAAEDALRELDSADTETTDASALVELRLVRALVHAKLGDAKQANELVREATALSSETADALRAEIRDAIGDASARPKPTRLSRRRA